MRTSERLPRTPHASTPHRGQGLPVWGERADGPTPGPGGRAAQSDRDDRAAWGVMLRSAYLSRVRLPDAVAAGDTATARAILERLEATLAEEAVWTPLERRRLRAMRDAWERRAGGRDVAFQFAGWQRVRATGVRGQKDARGALGLARVMEALDIWGK